MSPLLCDPIWHVSSQSGEASCKLLCPYFFESHDADDDNFNRCKKIDMFD